MNSRRSAFLLAFALFCASLASAQSKGTYQAGTSTPSGPATIPSNTGFLLGGIQPVQVVAGDFNRDGKQDFVAGASCTQGTANGSYGLTNCPGSVDGSNASVIATYIGNGDGTFRPAILSGGPGPSLQAIAVGDFNGDGIMDVATVSGCNNGDCTTGALTIMLGNGDGTFTAGASYPLNGTVSGANTVAVGDLRNDGKQDILVTLGCDFSMGCPNTSTSGAVLVFLGNGDGTFQTPVDYPTVEGSALPVVVGDFNKDGNQDVLLSVFVPSIGGSLIFFPGNGDGTLGTSVSTALPAFAGGTALAAADFNSDGNLDVVTISNGGVAVAFGYGNGMFQTATNYGLNNTVENFPQSIAVADVNGDGQADIVVGEGQGGTLNAAVVLINDGTGNFTNVTNYSMSGVGPVSVGAADFNGDGKNDILLAAELHTQNSSDGTINLLLGNGDGTFRSAQYVSTTGIGAEIGSVAATDFNGDGFQDLIVPICPGGTICPSGFALFLSDGAGGYQAPQTFASTTLVGELLAVGDFNKDGKPDVVVISNCADGSCSQDAASVFLNTGNGTFADSLVYDLGGFTPVAVATGDFNGDGKLDIAVLNQCATPSCGQAAVVTLLGNGDGTFGPAITTLLPSPSSWWLAAADLNRDGLTDLVVTESATDTNDLGAESGQVLISNGDGTFTLRGNYLTGGDIGNSLGATMAIGDVNGDGIPDIVAANYCDLTTNVNEPVDSGCANGAIGVLLGNGDGTFQPASVTNVSDTNFNGVSLADVNEDGKLDIVASVGPGIVVFLGNGDGTFQNPTTYLGGASPLQNVQFAIADLRNDGGLDVIQPNNATGLAIFYAQGFTLPSSATTVQSSLSPSVYAENVTFTATVASSSGTPTGTVTFTVDGSPFATVSLSGGTASITAPLLNAGTHSIAASYGGDGEHSPSNSAAIQQVVNQATTTTVVTSSGNPSYVTQTVTYAATVTSQFATGFVTGSITFMDGKINLGGIIIAHGFPVGKASISISEQYNTTGTHSMTAIYSGDGNNRGSASAALRQTVDTLPAATKTVVTTSGSPSEINQPVTFAAVVTSTFGAIPDGELVTFSSGTTTLATVPLTSGTAAYTTFTLKAGTSTISAKYAGDADFKASTGTAKQVVSLYSSTTTAPASNLNPSIFGQAVTLTTLVTSTAPSTPTGTVTFKNGAATLATATLDSSGTATLTRTTLPVGSLSITASYDGDSEIAKGTSPPLTQTVNQAQTTMTLSSSLNPSTVGASVKFTATLASNGGVPTGNVTFTNGSTTLGTATISGGKATFITKALPQGPDQITATYAGSADYSSAIASVTQQVN